jgi:pyruvate dehydrogenase E2 component (dihydrolipoamide acetyltransferase)
VTAPGRVFASPRARKLAAERGVDLARVQGSGPEGRIVEQDVQAHLEVVSGPAATPVARKMAEQAGLELTAVPGALEGRRIMRADVESALASTRPTPEATSQTPVETVALSGLRGIIAQRMGKSAHTTARVTLTTEVDATEFVQLRTLLKERLEPKLGFAPSYNDILVAMVSRALQEHPYINVRLTDEGIQTQPRINVGVAADTERGLLVPVIRDADQKGVAEIATGFRELVTRARAGKSTPDDLTGGTFTITNLGMFDIDAFTPIINLPECAILGVGRIREQPAAFKGQLCLRQMMVLSLTFDHRLVDGAPAARFLQRIKQLVEEPYLLLA